MPDKKPPSDPFGGREVLPEELHYHSREAPPEPDEYRKGSGRRGGVFKNNPSLILILVDIVVVVLVLIILLPLLRYDSRAEDFEGYDFSLHGYIDGQTAYLSVTAQPVSAPLAAECETSCENQEKYRLKIAVLDTDLEEELELCRDGQARILRTSFPVPGLGKEKKLYIRCVISLGERSVTLERSFFL